MSESRPIRSAATMIVLREQAAQIEVLMTRRHADLAFMGGMWVFPGGTLAPADQSEAARKRLSNADRHSYAMRDPAGTALSHAASLSHVIAACRETFEEAGVLLANRADGSPCSPEQLTGLQPERAAIAKDPERFVALLERENVFLDLARVIYWAHWITPGPAPRRFDTRFFVAAAPDSHAFEADSYETTECTWIAPVDLLAAADRGEMQVAAPTRCVLETLRAAIEKHRTLDTLLTGESARRISPILPKFVREDTRHLIVYPWDPEFQSFAGETASDPDTYYEPALVRMPSRVIRDH